jgi:hypothetical protein
MRNSAKRRHQLSREKPQAAPGQSQGDGRANLQRRLEFGFDTSEWRKVQNQSVGVTQPSHLRAVVALR